MTPELCIDNYFEIAKHLDRKTIITFACLSSDNYEIFKKIVKPDFDDFLYCIKSGDLKNIKWMIEEKHIDASANNNLAIIYASFHGHLDVVKFLSTLPQVDASDQDNLAIKLASVRGHIEVVNFISTLHEVLIKKSKIHYYKLVKNQINVEFKKHEIKKQIEELKTKLEHLIYKPGGLGYNDTLLEFEALN